MTLICFDLDDTLIQRTEAVRAGLTDFYLRYALPLADLDQMMIIDYGGYRPRQAVARAMVDRYGSAVDPEAVTAFWLEGAAPWVSLPRENREALVQLREAGHALAVITNGRTVQQQAKVARCGLAELVDAVLVSETVGIAKPSAAIFALAAREVGADLVDSWMVGDHAENDIVGGLTAGMRTVWISNGREWQHPTHAPNCTAETAASAVAHILSR